MNNTILIVEDEPKLASLLADYLRQAGFDTHHIADGLKVEAWVREHAPALLLLDLMLPGKDGLAIARDLRRFTEVPVIMVTAKVEEIDRLLGLELGADDYVCKPFSPREVVARVKTVLRRLNAPQAQPIADGVVLDPLRFRVSAGENSIELTAVEFHLMETLHGEPGRIYSRDQLMDRIYPDNRIVSDRTIDSHIKKLRRKLEGLLPGEELVHSVYGAGYKYEPPV
ncbi:MAG: response regulator [Gammaproteobacteria bacterium]|nr:response regulator [Gammaproteobacteria bacterium]MCP5137059.1 response regulator [Gammaproteobacteria bacterium]